MTLESLRARLADVVAIPPTPFTQAGEVGVDTYAGLVDRLVTAGIRVIATNGNTGEFYALTEAEARRCVELTVRTVGSRATVIVGVGHDVATAVGAARHARAAGAELVMVHQPVHPYVSRQGWVDYHRAIADAVPDTGVVLYIRNPATTGGQIAELAAACPNVVAVKYSVPDTVRFAAVARDGGLARLTWLAGSAELYAPPYFAVGATGFTSGLAIVHPELALRMFQALSKSDFPAAMEVWELARPFEQLRSADSAANNVSVVKEALAQLGLCRPDVRPPAHVLDDAGRAAVAGILAGWGLQRPA
jgi:4-hydroxy-tetrahydrodipicolinate synthase